MKTKKDSGREKFSDSLVSFLAARELVKWAEDAPSNEKAYWAWGYEGELIKKMEKAAKKLNKYFNEKG